MKKRFKISNNITKEQLINYGFVYHYPDKYIYRIPCYKYKKYSLVYLEFIILNENEDKNKINKLIMIINCKDRNDNFYFPFYGNYFNKNEVLNKVNRKLKIIIKDMVKKQIIEERKI